MPQIVAVGEGPIMFTDPSDGTQKSIPLSAVYFDGGRVKTNPPTVVDSPLDRWLQYLASEGRLAPSPTAPPLPRAAMVFTAAAPGSQGNNITVTVTPNTDPTKVDIAVSETDTYKGVTVGTIGSAFAAQAGMLTVAVGTSDPVAGAVTGAAPWVVQNSGGTAALTFTPRGAGSDTGTMTVTIGPVSNHVFDVTVLWTATATGVAAADLTPATALTTKLAPLAFSVAVSQPADGAGAALPYQLPKSGAATLAGGVDPRKASTAQLTA